MSKRFFTIKTDKDKDFFFYERLLLIGTKLKDWRMLISLLLITWGLFDLLSTCYEFSDMYYQPYLSHLWGIEGGFWSVFWYEWLPQEALITIGWLLTLNLLMKLATDCNELGKTTLIRKCRLVFGVGLFISVAVSFHFDDFFRLGKTMEHPLDLEWWLYTPRLLSNIVLICLYFLILPKWKAYLKERAVR